MLCIEQNDEWLVGRGYLSAESISLVLAGPDDHTDKEIKEEVAQLQAAYVLHHVPGLDWIEVYWRRRRISPSTPVGSRIPGATPLTRSRESATASVPLPRCGRSAGAVAHAGARLSGSSAELASRGPLRPPISHSPRRVRPAVGSFLPPPPPPFPLAARPPLLPLWPEVSSPPSVSGSRWALLLLPTSSPGAGTLGRAPGPFPAAGAEVVSVSAAG